MERGGEGLATLAYPHGLTPPHGAIPAAYGVLGGGAKPHGHTPSPYPPHILPDNSPDCQQAQRDVAPDCQQAQWQAPPDAKNPHGVNHGGWGWGEWGENWLSEQVVQQLI